MLSGLWFVFHLLIILVSAHLPINHYIMAEAGENNNEEVKPISIVKIATSQATTDGDGATVYRVIGNSKLQSFDPFLMLDEFHVTPPAGVPSTFP
jgi:hypothetical protein